MACATPHPFSHADASLLQRLKRKRADSAASPIASPDLSGPPCDDSPALKKMREGPNTPAPAAHLPASTPADKSLAPADPADACPASSSSSNQESTCRLPVPSTGKINLAKLDRAKDKIQSQINLEILYRHNELRLIDQEIAKVQIALEQIRRCQIVPYPGQPGASTNAYEASTGAGAPLQPSAGFSRPQHPAAFGVTNSPYTRHYQQWLLRDEHFDPIPLDMLDHSASKAYSAEGRSTRGFGERASFAASRSHRHAAGSSHQALPTSYPTPKPQAGPLIIRRLSDGLMVKLVCVWCQKENISSVQGFLNHCRIAHSENFASHEQAAQKCGQPIDAEQASTPSASTLPVTTPTAATPTSISSTPNVLVHPLVTSNRAACATSLPASPVSTPTRPSPSQASSSAVKPRARPQISIPADGQGTFVPSAAAPHLSALMKKIGYGQDLNKLVASAKTKINLDDVQPLTPDEEEPSELRTGASAPKTSGSMAPPSRTVGAQQPTKSAASSTSMRAFVPAPIDAAASFSRRSSGDASSFSPSSNGDASMTSPSIGPELSPHDTNPGLVSDYDEESSESESESSLAAGGRRRSLDVQVRGHSDIDEQVVASLAEDHSAVTCALDEAQLPAPQATPEPVQGQKRKRGRPSKAEVERKAKAI